MGFPFMNWIVVDGLQADADSAMPGNPTSLLPFLASSRQNRVI
jgi:hypothetical protein